MGVLIFVHLEVLTKLPLQELGNWVLIGDQQLNQVAMVPEQILVKHQRLLRTIGNNYILNTNHDGPDPGLVQLPSNIRRSSTDVGGISDGHRLVVYGEQFLKGNVPLSGSVLQVSGRGGFEIVQKAIVAGIPILSAVGAPSSLAVDLAREFDMSLFGFVRESRFNVYSDAGRLTAE